MNDHEKGVSPQVLSQLREGIAEAKKVIEAGGSFGVIDPSFLDDPTEDSLDATLPQTLPLPTPAERKERK